MDSQLSLYVNSQYGQLVEATNSKISNTSLHRRTVEPLDSEPQGFNYRGLTFRAVDGQKNIPPAFKAVLLKMGFQEYKKGEPGHSKKTTNLVFSKRSKLADLQSFLRSSSDFEATEDDYDNNNSLSKSRGKRKILAHDNTRLEVDVKESPDLKKVRLVNHIPQAGFLCNKDQLYRMLKK